MACVAARGQLTLDECKSMARENYPIIKQYALVEQSRDYTVSNASKAYLPQIQFNARAQYQSDATKFNGELPGIDFTGVSRDQYQFTLNVTQNIYDGGSTSVAKRIARQQGAVDEEQVNVNMYDVYQRVEEMYFGLLVLDAQLRQTRLLEDDLEVSYNNVVSMMAGGIANQTDVDAVRVQQLQAQQNEVGLLASRAAYLQMLSTFIGRDIAESETLVKPEDEAVVSLVNNRPELALYDARSLLYDERLKSYNTDVRPHLSVSLQGGYGDPGLNLFKTGFQFYYTVGATLSWNIGSFYTRSNSRKNIEVERQKMETERETFLLNTRLQTEREQGEIGRLRKQIAQDDEIIELRENIRSKSETKVENGTETVNEMLRDINAVSDARLQRDLHELQLLQEVYKLKTLNNN